MIMYMCVDAFTEKIPKSPVRELLEMEPETAKFEYVYIHQLSYSHLETNIQLLCNGINIQRNFVFLP